MRVFRVVALALVLAAVVPAAAWALEVGQKAPDFTLPTHDGKNTVTLSKLVGTKQSKPVVLIFGSFT